MVDYVDAIKYPLKDVKSFSVGFLLSVFWFLLIPIIFVYGYVIEVIRGILQQKDELPHWATSKDWLKFLKHGIYVIAIGLVYLIPPFAVSAAASSMMGGASYFLSQGFSNSVNPLGLSLMIISSVLFFVSIFLLPMAIILYAASEDIRYAFNLDEILPRIKKLFIPYFKVYLISIVAYIPFLVLLTIPFVNFLFGGILFYPLLFSVYLFAQLFREHE